MFLIPALPISQSTACRATTTTKIVDSMSSSTRRRRRGSTAALQELAERIIDQRVVFVTGAGISVASGIRPFRGRVHQKDTLQEVRHGGALVA